MTASDRPRPARGDRGGFVLAFVVLMLFTISVAGATGYLVVNTEFAMSRHGTEGAEALAVARAGLERYAAEQLGVLGDSVSYAVGDGTALVTRVKVVSKDSLTDLYYLRSEGTVTDILTPSTPARRVVGGYAWHHRRPLRQFGALMISESQIEVKGWLSRDEVVGQDSSTVADCSGGGADPITGVIALTNVTGLSGGDWTGSPDDETWGTYAAMYDSVALRWDVLSDPSFPVDFENAWPNFGTLPADSFPVIRLTGSWYFSNAWDGRGVLIVTGEYDAASDFDWSGIILAGSVDGHVHGQVRGMFIGGLAGPNPGSNVTWHATADYYSCYGYEANESLSYLELLENTVFESN